MIAFADSLEAEAVRIGAARGRAFAVTLRGEAKLLCGQLDEADDDLVAGAELHREIAAATGEAFALQRRAEVALHRGRQTQAVALLDEALAVARESDVVMRLPAWYAALDEVKGHRAQANGDTCSAGEHFRTAAAGFEAAGQPLDAARCGACAATLAAH